MSWEEGMPSNLIPIKDVNEEEVQKAGRFAVEESNRNGSGHHFIYKRVVNRLLVSANLGPINRIYIIVIEVIIDYDDMPWSYIAMVGFYRHPWTRVVLLSFEDVLKDFNKH